jgi:hypothetical protein
MTGKRKSAGRAGRSEADLGQKEAGLEKTQAELENASETQLSHMEGGKRPRLLGSRRRKFGLNSANAQRARDLSGLVLCLAALVRQRAPTEADATLRIPVRLVMSLRRNLCRNSAPSFG